MKKAICFIMFLAFGLIYTPVFAEYKIILKNGREFIVDDYKDVNGKIKFYKMGGEMEIDKGNVENIKKVKVTKTVEETAPAETIKKDSPEGLTPAEKGKDLQTKRQELANRLKEIEKKKEEMRAEGEKLSGERKKLEEDYKKEGRVTSIREKREYERRFSELEEKIKKFNEEMSRLEQEDERLYKEFKETGAQQKQK